MLRIAGVGVGGSIGLAGCLGGTDSQQAATETTTGATTTGSNETTGEQTTTGSEATGEGTTTEETTSGETPSRLTFGAPLAAAAGVSPRVVRDQGFAANGNLQLDLQLEPPPALQQKIQGKGIESATFPVISGARLANQGRAIRLLAPVARSFNSIIVRKGTGISGIEDLQNTKLGSMPRTSAPWTHLALLLALEGYDYEDYDFQFGPPNVLFGLMTKGDLDAMVGVEPFSTRLLATGEYREFFVFNERWNELRGSDMPLVEVATYQSTLDEKPAAFSALVDSLIQAGQYISDNPQQVFEQYADVLGLQNRGQIELAIKRFADIYPTEFATDLRESGKEVVRLAAERNLLEKQPPLDEMFVDPRDF